MTTTVTVQYLKTINFSQLSLERKVEIKNIGRPIPEVQITQAGSSHNKKYIRSFNYSWYEKYPWLCGCEIKNKLFCFPCLLFGCDSVWTQNGFALINNLKEKCELHQASKSHVNNSISLRTLGRINIAQSLSEAYRLSKIQHNEQVQKNRNILSKLIDTVKLCATLELPLRGHDESESSDNQGVYKEVLNYGAKLNPELREHLNSNSAFKGTSKTTQDELLQCMLEVCQEQIVSEITESEFLAVMADDTTDVTGNTQTVIVFRYQLHGTVYERFWGYFNPEDETAEGLSECIGNELKKVLKNDSHKLIAQTYDGASVMSGEKQGVQKKIQDIYKYAYYIHCYTHQVNLVMKNVTSSIRSVRIFFSDLSGIPAFFSQSPKRLDVLKKYLPSNTLWNFNIQTVDFVFENKEQLIKCFEEMVSLEKDKTFDKAKGYLALLNNEHFLFWLQLFHKIMPHVELLHSQMQSRNIDAALIEKLIIDSFCCDIEEIRDSELCNSGSLTEIAESKEICDRMTMDCRERFAFTSHLIAAKLFYSEHFPQYSENLPLFEISETCRVYPFLEEEKLKTELEILYSRQEYHSAHGLTSLLQLIIHDNIHEFLSQTTNLLRILVTVPMTTAEPERCFSTLKRIKTYQRNSTSQDRLLALAMVSVEKNMISRISDFNTKVIEKFSSKTCRMEFTFK
uniref:Zinc finger MYM-type protein 1 n=1 Tax=Cacopsylla melanoneura TaxID=428564 RepID=A0A8D8VVN1_9HEMI